jgi:hypothetical protein
MTRYAKRKLKYSLNENFNLLPYVEWDQCSDGYKSTMDWCSVYLTPQDLPKYIYLSPPLIFPTTYNGIRTKIRLVWITPGPAPIHWMGPIRNPYGMKPILFTTIWCNVKYYTIFSFWFDKKQVKNTLIWTNKSDLILCTNKNIFKLILSSFLYSKWKWPFFIIYIIQILFLERILVCNGIFMQMAK